MPDQEGDKSQDPTPHRRQKAREKGQVAKSQDLSSAVLLLLAVGLLFIFGGGAVNFLAALTARQLGTVGPLTMGVERTVALYYGVLWLLARYVLPIMGAMFLGAVLVNVFQVGPLFLPEKLAPDITRLDPLKGLGRLFSIVSVMRLTFGVFKILIIAAVAFVSLYAEKETILGLAGMAVPKVAYYMVQILLWTTVKIGVALLVLALLDFAFQKWKHEQDLKMTHQEVREEMKNLEGNPEVLQRRRQVQRELARQRLDDAVPKADVVVTNPTELSVAIQYEPTEMAAPIVVAKGAGVIAQRIRRLALENNIPMVERKPLAQSLFRDVEVDHPVPEDKYAAVAEVLAYVYALKGKKIPGSEE